MQACIYIRQCLCLSPRAFITPVILPIYITRWQDRTLSYTRAIVPFPSLSLSRCSRSSLCSREITTLRLTFPALLPPPPLPPLVRAHVYPRESLCVYLSLSLSLFCSRACLVFHSLYPLLRPSRAWYIWKGSKEAYVYIRSHVSGES